MKELPIRKFTTVVSYLNEPVTITKDGRAIGTFTPMYEAVQTSQIGTFTMTNSSATPDEVAQVQEMWKGASVDEPVKKAIEPDKAKVQRGRLTKGLGQLPGEDPDKTFDPSFGRSKPAPKPGKGK